MFCFIFAVFFFYCCCCCVCCCLSKYILLQIHAELTKRGINDDNAETLSTKILVVQISSSPTKQKTCIDSLSETRCEKQCHVSVDTPVLVSTFFIVVRFSFRSGKCQLRTIPTITYTHYAYINIISRRLAASWALW